MHSFRRIFDILTVLAFGLMITSCLYTNVSALEFDAAQYDHDRAQFTKTFISEYYQQLSQDMEERMKVVNGEEEFKDIIGAITPGNAAEVLGFALVMRSDAPKADEIFRTSYDPFKPYIYDENPYKKSPTCLKCKRWYDPFKHREYKNPNYQKHPVILAPETEEEADALAELNVGVATQWPILVQVKRKSPHKVHPKYKITEETNMGFFLEPTIVNDGQNEINNGTQAVSGKRKFTEHRIQLSHNVTKFSAKPKKRKY